MKKYKLTTFSILAMAFIAGCTSYIPKPKAYPRIDYPVKNYVAVETECPFTFERPTYSKLIPIEARTQNCWYNLAFTPFDATLHLSYVTMSSPSDLDSLTEDAYKMVYKPHTQVAVEIIQSEIIDTTQGYYGMIYDLEGKTATPFNFYLTDKKNHFFRGSFYFNSKTEADSVQPIYDFLNKDIMHTISTFKFKN